MNIEEKIISNINKNRISSTEVADALNKSGVIDGIIPVNGGLHVTGKVEYIYAFDETNWPVHVQARNIQEGSIVFVDTFNCNNKAIFGDLVAKYLILYKRAKAVVVNGLLRDVPNLRKEGFPIWCTGFTPLGCFNRDVAESDELKLKVAEYKALFEGGIMTCDDSGVTLIKKELINENTLKRLDWIELQEDIWFFCIDTLKWDTYDTVCLKKYLNHMEVLPEALREKVKEISFDA